MINFNTGSVKSVTLGQNGSKLGPRRLYASATGIQGRTLNCSTKAGISPQSGFFFRQRDQERTETKNKFGGLSL